VFRLPASASFIAVASRDAAGNLTRDDNNGAYYEPEPDLIPGPGVDDLVENINELVRAGDEGRASERTVELVMQLKEQELSPALERVALPEDDLEAGLVALRELVGETNGGLNVVERGEDFVELAAESGDPLSEPTFIDVPGELVAEEFYPVLAELIARVRPGLSLEMEPVEGTAHYRIRRGTA
jgi:hypothetical protein